MHIKLYVDKKFKIRISLLVLCLIVSAISFSRWTFYSNENSESKEISECVKLPVLMYHLVLKNPSTKNKFIVSSETFEEDLKYISQNGYTTILVKDLIDYTQGKADLPPKPILLTFDDGAFNNYAYAFPIAKKYNAKFVFSPIAKESEKYSELTDENPSYAHASWKHIKEMSQSGLVEIQNHTYNMHSTGKKRLGCTKSCSESEEEYKKKLTSDISKAQKLIQENTGIEPTAMFYPFGACSNLTESIVRSMGFKATFMCESKVNKITRDPNCLFGLHRFLRPPGVSAQKFFSSLEK